MRCGKTRVFFPKPGTLVFPLLLLSSLLFSVTGLDAARGDRELYAEAERRYFGAQYTLSLELYEDFLGEFPLSNLAPDAQYRRGLCLFRLDRFTEAREVFDLVEKRYRASRYIEYVPFYQGVVSYQLGDFGGARERLGTFLSSVKDAELSSQALHYKALAEVALGLTGEAVATMTLLAEGKGEKNLTPYEVVLFSGLLLKEERYGDLVRFQDRFDIDSLQGSMHERALLYRAEALWNLGDETGAAELYNRLLDGETGAAIVAYRRLYAAAQRRAAYAEMERIILRAEKRFGGTPEVLADFWISIGLENYRRGDLELSRYFLMKVWSLRGGWEIKETVPLTLAEIAAKEGDAAGAREVIDEYLSTAGEPPSSALLRIGGIELRLGMFEEASRTFEEVLKMEKVGAIRDRTLYLLAYANYRSGEYASSIDDVSKLIGTAGEGAAADDSVTRGALRLKAAASGKAGDVEGAARSLGDYVDRYPDDTRARLDLLRLQFSEKDFAGVTRNAGLLLSGRPTLERDDLRVYLLATYLEGLAYVSQKFYQRGAESLRAVTGEKAKRAGVEQILPFSRYYLAWSLYRLNQFGDAARGFSDFVGLHPAHELVPQALFMEGWCFYSLGEFERAKSSFARVGAVITGKPSPAAQTGSPPPDPLYDKAKLLEGRSLFNLRRLDEAQKIFVALYRSRPDSPYADDALFEHATILAETGKRKDAVKAFMQLADRYPSSGLAQEALYKRGEIAFEGGDYRGAKEAFAEYLVRYPGGNLADAALYWEGFALYKSGDRGGAVSLWETLIAGYPKSPFRADALVKSAQAYGEGGDYRRGLVNLDTLKKEYPDYAKAVNADVMAETMRYRVFGLSGREAELTALISRHGGAKSRDGRVSMIELARIYIFEDPETASGQPQPGRTERAFQMLSQVVEEEDPLTGGEAQFLLGEYYWRMKEWEKAGREFVKASTRNSGNRDFAASSLLRAAQSMKQAGKPRETQELVKRLVDGFSGTRWAEEGKKLVENAK